MKISEIFYRVEWFFAILCGITAISVVSINNPNLLEKVGYFGLVNFTGFIISSAGFTCTYKDSGYF